MHIFFILYNRLFVGVNLIMILYCKSLILLSTGANAGRREDIKKGGMIQKEGIIAGRGDVYIRTL